jgi:hypothetical protein
MTNAAEIADAEPAPKKGKLGLILGLVGALALGGGGFYAVYAGMLQPSALLGGGGHDTGGRPAGTGRAGTGCRSRPRWRTSPSCRWTRS